MKVRYTDNALGEVDEICSHIARDSPSAASEVADAIERTVALIAERPASAPAREFPVTGERWGCSARSKITQESHYREPQPKT
jgi:plasmid stabilization system protein ParE